MSRRGQEIKGRRRNRLVHVKLESQNEKVKERDIPEERKHHWGETLGDRRTRTGGKIYF